MTYALQAPMQVTVSDNGEPLLWAAAAYGFDSRFLYVGDMVPVDRRYAVRLRMFRRTDGRCEDVVSGELRLIDNDLLAAVRSVVGAHR